MIVTRTSQHPLRSLRRFVALILVGITLSLGVAACSWMGKARANEIQLTLVSFAVTRGAYETIIPKFAEQWKRQTGQSVTFGQSYGGSGSQTRAVIDGLDADVVALALALDVKKLEKAGLIEPGWEQELPNNSVPYKSVAAFVTPNTNTQITQWADLVRDNLQIITANPKTSGGARWNFLGLWGSVTEAGGSDREAQAFVEKVFQNVPILPRDAREASDVFYKQSQGDVLINYENEVILAKQRGYEKPYIVPLDYNISIDSPVAVMDKNVDKHGTREVAEAFVKYLFTPEAQREFAKIGFRPVEATVADEFSSQYPQVKKLFTVQDLGGWDAVQTKFFEDGAVFDKIQANLTKTSSK